MTESRRIASPQTQTPDRSRTGWSRLLAGFILVVATVAVLIVWRILTLLLSCTRLTNKALRLEPESAITHLNLGNALERPGKFEAAERHYTEALRLDPGFVKAHTG